LRTYNTVLEIRQGSAHKNLNPIERYYALYKHSDFVERFMIEMNNRIDCIVKKHKYAPLKLHLNYQSELKLGFLEIIPDKILYNLAGNDDDDDDDIDDDDDFGFYLTVNWSL
jgi:hypothetical protein